MMQAHSLIMTDRNRAVVWYGDHFVYMHHTIDGEINPNHYAYVDLGTTPLSYETVGTVMEETLRRENERDEG